MRSLKLSGLIRRNPDRPSLKERAVSLRASASRAIRGEAQAGRTPPAVALPPADDSALAALEAEFQQADHAHSQAAAALDAACERYVEPPMPKELRVWRNDWINSHLPRTRLYRIEGREGVFSAPYGQAEVDQIRGARCMRQTYRGDGEESPSGGYWKPDLEFQKRVDAIVTAWDTWRAAVQAARAELQIPDLIAMADATSARRHRALEAVLETPALTLAGLGVKARIANAVCGNGGVKTYGLESYDASNEEALPFDIAGDVLAFGAASTDGADVALIALGREFEAARTREIRAHRAADKAETQAGTLKPKRPECLILREEDEPFRLAPVSSGQTGEQVFPLDIEYLRKHNFRREVWRPVRDGERGWNMKPGFVPEMQPWPEAQARAGEIVAAWDAWRSECDRADRAERTDEIGQIADDASDETAAIAEQIAALSAATAEGLRIKIRVAAFYAGEPDTDYPAGRLMKSLMADAGATGA